MSINKAILIGNVGNAPEIRVTGSGGEIASFSVATTESWKDKNSGEKKDKTEWHRISVFSPGLVSVVKNYVKKGSKLYIEGQLRNTEWVGQDNQKRQRTEIVLSGYGAVLQILSSTTGDNRTFTEDNYTGGGDSAFVDSYANDAIEDEVPF